MKLIVNCKLESESAIPPRYMTDGAGCFDFFANIDEPVTVKHGKPIIFDTGCKFEIPAGWVMKIYSRSGHGFKFDTRLANCVGIIDSDYRGEVKVKLTADVGGSVVINPGDAIAQGMLEKVIKVEFDIVNELSVTDRGENGFGHTTWPQ